MSFICGYFHFIAVVCGSRTWAAIISLLLAAALLLAAVKFSQALEQGPYTMQLVPEEFSTSKEAYSIEGVAEDMFDGLVMETVPNPNYLSGGKREAVQFFYDMNPAGQTTQSQAVRAGYFASGADCSAGCGTQRNIVPGWNLVVSTEGY